MCTFANVSTLPDGDACCVLAVSLVRSADDTTVVSGFAPPSTSSSSAQGSEDAVEVVERDSRISPHGPLGLTMFWTCIILTACALWAIYFRAWEDPAARGLLVLCFGWVTAISTGLGILPFLCFTEVSDCWLGRCNGA